MFLFLALFLKAFCEFKIFDGSRLTEFSYSIDQNYDASKPVSIETFDQEMISYYSWFASYGYCEDIFVPLFCCKNDFEFFTGKWNMINEGVTDKFFVYNFILWRNDEFKKYIAAFPGTNEVLELINEIIQSKLVNYDEDGQIKVVNYFKKVVFEIKDMLFTPEILEDIIAHPGYQFISTGHSLGGAIASLMLYDAVNNGYIDPKKNEPVLITYGQPRTGNKNFVIDFNKKIKNVLRVVRDNDIVVNIPFSPDKNSYTHLGGLILINKDMTEMTYCPQEIGEEYPDKECRKKFSINFKYHTHYKIIL